FFLSGAAAHEYDLAFGYSLNAAPQPKNDFIGKLVRGKACCFGRGSISVLLSKNLWGAHVLHVVKPALDGHVVPGNAKVAEGEHRGVGWWRTPRFELYVGRRADRAERIETFGDYIEDSGVIEIAEKCVVENSQQIVVLRILSGGLEIGYGNTDLLNSEACTG